MSEHSLALEETSTNDIYVYFAIAQIFIWRSQNQPLQNIIQN